MNEKINVINNTGKEVRVTINESDGSTQVIIDLARNQRKFSDLQPGDVFTKNGINFILMEWLDPCLAHIVREDLLPNDRKFGDNNDLYQSDIRAYLNGKYLEEELYPTFGKENIMEHEIDLLSLDGLEDYGTIKCKAGLLTLDDYRNGRKRKIFKKNMDRPWFLATPNSTPSGYGSRGVRIVGSGGYVSYDDCDWGRGVRPDFYLRLSSEIFVSCPETTE